MAALAKVDVQRKVARRFEVFVDGIELANGYHELQNAKEQRKRFEQDLKKRQQRKLPLVKIDENLLAALENGLPAVAGVALGVEISFVENGLVNLATEVEGV